MSIIVRSLQQTQGLRALFFFFTVISIAPESLSATIKTIDQSEPGYEYCRFTIDVQGEIINGDSKKLDDELQLLSKKYKIKDQCLDGYNFLSIDSIGGDVFESMRIGQIVRANNLFVVVPINSVCFSSCLFILSGGVKRGPYGKVGVHRPYLYDSGNTKDIKMTRKDINKRIRAYLEEMDISTSLLDKMLSVPPEKIKILSWEELTDLRLSVDDANFEEQQVALWASSYNLPSSVYRIRYEEAKIFCKNENAVNEISCKDSIILKITKSEAIRRRTRAWENCPTELPRTVLFQCIGRYMSNR
jgi:hypothetical protein